MTAAIVLGHAVGYYCAHRWMHTRRMYWDHRFHHRFNKYVVPVTANAVSLAEYAIAYMLPFIAGSILLRNGKRTTGGVCRCVAVGWVGEGMCGVRTARAYILEYCARGVGVCIRFLIRNRMKK